MLGDFDEDEEPDELIWSDDRACDEGKGLCAQCKHCFCCHANDQTNCVIKPEGA